MVTLVWAVGTAGMVAPAAGLAAFCSYNSPPFTGYQSVSQAGGYLLVVLAVLTIALLTAAAVGMSSRRGFGEVALAVGGANVAVVLLVVVPWVLASNNVSVPAYPPNTIQDQTRFARTFFDVHRTVYPGWLRGAQRQHWWFDEVGLVSPDAADFSMTDRMGWEDYGVPLRSFRIPFRFDQPRGDSMEHLTATVLSVQVLPIGLACSLLIWTASLTSLVRSPRCFRWIRRALTGRCVHCGHLLTVEQAACPECGNAVAPIDRVFVGLPSRSSRGGGAT